MSVEINHKESKLIIVDHGNKLHLMDALGLETIENFIYLGSNISNTGSYTI